MKLLSLENQKYNVFNILKTSKFFLKKFKKKKKRLNITKVKNKYLKKTSFLILNIILLVFLVVEKISL